MTSDEINWIYTVHGLVRFRFGPLPAEPGPDIEVRFNVDANLNLNLGSGPVQVRTRFGYKKFDGTSAVQVTATI